MRIDRDMNRQLHNNSVAQSRKGVVEQGRVSQKSGTPQQGSRVSGNREMTNALLIMGKAQAIVQQALTVSGRLQSMAATSLSAPSLEVQQVGRELQSINASLGELGAGVIPPAIEQGVKRELPELQHSVAALDPKTGASSEDERAAVTERLSQQAERFERMGSSLEREYGVSRRVPENITATIIGSSKEALVAQGNIVPESVERLLQ